jgi:hypothetical protein
MATPPSIKSAKKLHSMIKHNKRLEAKRLDVASRKQLVARHFTTVLKEYSFLENRVINPPVLGGKSLRQDHIDNLNNLIYVQKPINAPAPSVKAIKPKLSKKTPIVEKQPKKPTSPEPRESHVQENRKFADYSWEDARDSLEKTLSGINWDQEKKDSLIKELETLPKAERIGFLEQLGVKLPPVPTGTRTGKENVPDIIDLDALLDDDGGKTSSPKSTPRVVIPPPMTEEEEIVPQDIPRPDVGVNPTIQIPFIAYSGSDPFVFVSYAHKDRDRVYPIIDTLHKNGIRIWYDEGIEAGEDWREAIIKRLRNCEIFLIFLTPIAVVRYDVLNEISIAEKRYNNNNVKIIPVLLDNFFLPDDVDYSFSRIPKIIKPELEESDFFYQLFTSLGSKVKEIDTRLGDHNKK